MRKKPLDERSLPTAFEHFLYLLTEIERILERGQVVWPPGQADRVQDRLARIAQTVAQASRGRTRRDEPR
ncbi:MAG: hypothetical protein JOZ17_08720 [Acetobacteraceae bacterium]|nr:hypothetical protein [Acetobacteraceae bacterium]